LIRLRKSRGAIGETVVMPTVPEAPVTAPTRTGRDRPTAARLLRELRTIEAMTEIYCRDHHGGAPLCAECRTLVDYAAKRLAVCPFGADKPVCAKCQVHCYAPAKREQVREVMRQAGPKMMFRHPWLALAHVFDKRYVAPPKPRARKAVKSVD
jgi:hypothetical protein